MSLYANVSEVPLSLAVFLATDNYDHESNTISVTQLIRPLRQIILSNRVASEDASVDLIQMVPSRVGTAIHTGIQDAWLNNYANALKILGMPQKVVDRVVINPKPENLIDGVIPFYLEQRAYKTIGNYTISGKFDFIGDGRVEDVKTTSTFTAMNNTNDSKYILQGSIYRWLNPTIITKDEMAIQFIFTDWSSVRAKSDPTYPQKLIQERILKLMPIIQTELFIKNKLDLIDYYSSKDEKDIPCCTDDELWRSAPVFKYYKNRDKTLRSTKNFDNRQDAMIRNSEDGGKGIVIEKPGQVTACRYCAVFSACTQKDSLIAQGDLII